MGLGRLFVDPVANKKALVNSTTPTVGSVAIMDSPTSPQYGHVGIVVAVNGDQVTVKDSNYGGKQEVGTHTMSMSKINQQ